MVRNVLCCVQHKIWTLAPKIVSGAQEGVRAVPTKWRDQASLSYSPAVAAALAAAKKQPPIDLWPLRSNNLCAFFHPRGDCCFHAFL